MPSNKTHTLYIVAIVIVLAILAWSFLPTSGYQTMKHLATTLGTHVETSECNNDANQPMHMNNIGIGCFRWNLLILDKPKINDNMLDQNIHMLFVFATGSKTVGVFIAQGKGASVISRFSTYDNNKAAWGKLITPEQYTALLQAGFKELP